LQYKVYYGGKIARNKGWLLEVLYFCTQAKHGLFPCNGHHLHFIIISLQK